MRNQRELDVRCGHSPDICSCYPLREIRILNLATIDILTYTTICKQYAKRPIYFDISWPSNELKSTINYGLKSYVPSDNLPKLVKYEIDNQALRFHSPRLRSVLAL